jgi:hypothetical protein
LKGKLERALRKRFPKEKVGLLAEILSISGRKKEISYEEIVVRKEVKDELLLFAEGERLLLPNAMKSLAWDDRFLTLRLGEKYKMPNVVEYLVENAGRTGEWDPDYAIERYLREIGENEAGSVMKIFNKVEEKIKGSKLTPETLKESLNELGLKMNIEKVIIELKGGGIISPCLRDSERTGHLQYEINPSCLNRKINNQC